jgi:hypothetical protein
VPIGLDEGLLVHVLRVLLVGEHMQRQAKHALVVAANQRVERGAVALLRLADEVVILNPLLRARFQLRRRQLCSSSPGLCRRFRH